MDAKEAFEWGVYYARMRHKINKLVAETERRKGNKNLYEFLELNYIDEWS